MKVKDLKKSLERFDDDAIIYVGCEGYSNYENPKDEYVINIRKIVSESENAILIADSCYYDDLGIDYDEW